MLLNCVIVEKVLGEEILIFLVFHPYSCLQKQLPRLLQSSNNGKPNFSITVGLIVDQNGRGGE